LKVYSHFSQLVSDTQRTKSILAVFNDTDEEIKEGRENLKKVEKLLQELFTFCSQRKAFNLNKKKSNYDSYIIGLIEKIWTTVRNAEPVLKATYPLK
jgi:predicted KAP-like P-loop ATPase